MDSRADTCCSSKNWRLLSTTGQLCDVKVFHNLYEAIANVPLGRSATAVIHNDGTVYILIFNEDLFLERSIYYSLINPNHIRSFVITESNNPFNRTREFGIDHEELLITFKTMGTTVFFTPMCHHTTS